LDAGRSWETLSFSGGSAGCFAGIQEKQESIIPEKRKERRNFRLSFFRAFRRVRVLLHPQARAFCSVRQINKKDCEEKV